jgi:putative N6-adenine-specific DNA methylase
MHVVALAARGTHDLVAAECRTRSLKVLRVDADGVHLDLTWRELAMALIHLRVAQRLLIALGSCEADDGESLYQGARRIDWGEWLNARSTFAVWATGDTVPAGKRADGRPYAGLTDLRFVALRVKDAIADDLTRRLGRRPDVDRVDPVVSVMVRGRQGRWSFYLDAADPPLFQRGFRVAAGPASLKETLAAACVDLSGWSATTRLIDPLCGSGTLVIEAASKALGLAPGCTRTFAVERWPQHGKTMTRWCDEIRQAAVAHAKQAIGETALRIEASDIDPLAVQAARDNVAAAGLDGVIEVLHRDARDLPHQPAGTVLVCNPPYGERLGGAGVETLYRELGASWQGKGLSVAHVLSGHEGFESAFGWPIQRRHALANGDLAVTLLQCAPPRS